MDTRKFVAIVSNELPFGVAVNALAHMSAGLAARLIEKGEPLLTSEGFDGNAVAHLGIIQELLEVRCGTSHEIRQFRQSAVNAGVVAVDFTRTMTGDTYVEQLERTKATHESDLQYYGLILAGVDEAVAKIFG